MDDNASAPSNFKNVEIGWKGTTYVVNGNRVMGLLARIEEILAPNNGDVIRALTAPHQVHLTRWARAYAAALRYAGADVTDEQVYLSMAQGVMKGGAEGFDAIATLSSGILEMFFPSFIQSEPLAENSDEGSDASGN